MKKEIKVDKRKKEIKKEKERKNGRKKGRTKVRKKVRRGKKERLILSSFCPRLHSARQAGRQQVLRESL